MSNWSYFDIETLKEKIIYLRKTFDKGKEIRCITITANGK